MNLCSGTKTPGWSNQPEDHSCENVDNIFKSVNFERDKIEKNILGLKDSISYLKTEREDLKNSLSEVKKTISTVETKIKTIHEGNLKIIQLEIDSLIKERDTLIRDDSLLKEYRHIEKQLLKLNVNPGDPAEDILDDEKSDARDFQELKYSISDVLKEWEFRGNYNIEVNDQKNDIIINGKARNDFGKGLRSVYLLAAMTGLLKFSLLKNRPHPGFIVADTPFNPFKGKVVSNPDEGALISEQDKIYSGLLRQYTENQLIILENKRPSDNILNQIHFVSFDIEDQNSKDGFLKNV